MGARPRHDARFYALGPPRSLGDVAAHTGATLRNPESEAIMVGGVAPIDDAQSDELTFAAGRGVQKRLAASSAGACFVGEADAGAGAGSAGPALLLADDPKRAFTKAAALFVAAPGPADGAHARAVIADDARLGLGVSVGPCAVVEAGAEVGAGTVIGPGAVIARGCVVGSGCDVGANAVISHSLIGDRVRIGAGAVVGGPGFGFAGGLDGHVRTPQIGRVVIGDDVEIGACTTVDRGALGDTVIETGAKIDNLVQIAHNCRIGAHAVVVAQVGFAGSVTVGSFAVLGGQAGIADHVAIGEGAQVGARSGVMRDVAAGAKVLGAPAKPAYAFFREVAAVQRLAAREKGQARTMKDGEG